MWLWLPTESSLSYCPTTLYLPVLTLLKLKLLSPRLGVRCCHRRRRGLVEESSVDHVLLRSDLWHTACTETEHVRKELWLVRLYWTCTLVILHLSCCSVVLLSVDINRLHWLNPDTSVFGAVLTVRWPGRGGKTQRLHLCLVTANIKLFCCSDLLRLFVRTSGAEEQVLIQDLVIVTTETESMLTGYEDKEHCQLISKIQTWSRPKTVSRRFSNTARSVQTHMISVCLHLEQQCEMWLQVVSRDTVMTHSNSGCEVTPSVHLPSDHCSSEQLYSPREMLRNIDNTL